MHLNESERLVEITTTVKCRVRISLFSYQYLVRNVLKLSGKILLYDYLNSAYHIVKALLAKSLLH